MNSSMLASDDVRARLNSIRTELLGRRSRVRYDLQRRNEPLSPDADERAIQLENDETLQAIDDSLGSDLTAVERALIKLDNNSYGICDVCRAPIGAARLRTLPHAFTCVECERD